MGDTQKRSLLFATTEVPYPATSGGRIKTYRLIKYLAQRFDLRLVCAHALETDIDLNALRIELGVSSIQVFDTFKQRNPWNWFLAIMQFPTWSTFRVYSKKLESMLKWGISGADVVIMDHLDLIEMLPEKDIHKVYYHSHNAEFKLWAELAKLESNPIKKALISLEADRVKRFESWVIRNVKSTFAAPNDIELLAEVSKADRSKFLKTYHLGNDALLDLPGIDIESNGTQVFYAGTLSWEPNRDGIIWFLKQSWPLIIERIPTAELIVCGKGANAELLDIMKHTKGITYRGFVPDLEPIISRSTVSIVPLRFGSGMKIKTFEAMYRGLPFVSTTEGVDGIEVHHEVHCLVQNEPEQFAHAVIELLNNKSKAAHLAIESRKLATSEYTYDKIFEQMVAKLS